MRCGCRAGAKGGGAAVGGAKRSWVKEKSSLAFEHRRLLIPVVDVQGRHPCPSPKVSALLSAVARANREMIQQPLFPLRPSAPPRCQTNHLSRQVQKARFDPFISDPNPTSHDRGGSSIIGGIKNLALSILIPTYGTDLGVNWGTAQQGYGSTPHGMNSADRVSWNHDLNGYDRDWVIGVAAPPQEGITPTGPIGALTTLLGAPFFYFNNAGLPPHS